MLIIWFLCIYHTSFNILSIEYRLYLILTSLKPKIGCELTFWTKIGLFLAHSSLSIVFLRYFLGVIFLSDWNAQKKLNTLSQRFLFFESLELTSCENFREIFNFFLFIFHLKEENKISLQYFTFLSKEWLNCKNLFHLKH